MRWSQALLCGFFLLVSGQSLTVYNRAGQCSEQIVDFQTSNCWDNGIPDQNAVVMLNNMSSASVVNSDIIITQLILNNTHLDVLSSQFRSVSVLFYANSSLSIRNDSSLTLKNVTGDGSLVSEGQVLLVADVYGPPSFAVSDFQVTRLLFSDMQLWNMSWSVVINASRPITIQIIELNLNNRSHGNSYAGHHLLYSPSGFWSEAQVVLSSADPCNQLATYWQDEEDIYCTIEGTFNVSTFSPVMVDTFQSTVQRHFALQHANATWLSCYDRTYQRVYTKGNILYDQHESTFNSPSDFTADIWSKFDSCTDNNVKITVSFEVLGYGQVYQQIDRLDVLQVIPFVNLYSPYNDFTLKKNNIQAMSPMGDRITILTSNMKRAACGTIPDNLIINGIHHDLSVNGDIVLTMPHCSVNLLNYTLQYGFHGSEYKSIKLTPFVTPKVPDWNITVERSALYDNPSISVQLLSDVCDCDLRSNVYASMFPPGYEWFETQNAERGSGKTWQPMTFHEKTQWNETVIFSPLISCYGNDYYQNDLSLPDISFNVSFASDYSAPIHWPFTGIPSTSSSSSSVASTTSRDRFTLSRLTEIGSTAETAEEKWDDTMDWWAVALPVILLVAIVAGVVYVFYKSYLEKKEKKGWIPLGRK
ncbi:hypothetical protein PROFUN_05126 [Planoprotostelium fungivorum]|uniref:Uncharacterized protein n=1 Tax=Planoprotostelium fungivorum TaxID=1890364 RepID=A0A2P6NRR6_9EUKA|nr:hypothetical protein PROFUN_05126 [Planoprotostelium fungivorum]